MADVPQQSSQQQKPFVIIPLKHRSKEPACRFKAKNSFNTDSFENTGVRLDRLLVLDIDKGRLPDGVTVEGAVNTLRDMGVPVDSCPRVRTGSGGEHIYLALPHSAPKLQARFLTYIDVKAGRGAYVVAPGSIHPNGNKYKRLNDVKLADAPTAPQSLMRMLERPAVGSAETTPGLLSPEQLAAVLLGLDVVEFREHDRWLELMMACRHACPEGDYEFVHWSTGDPVYHDHGDSIAERWRSISPSVDGGITTATLYKRLIEARDADPDLHEPRRALAVMDFATLDDYEDVRQEAQSGNRRLLSVEELIALEPPEWLLERSLPVGSLGVLYGPPKAAKTFWALDFGLSVASGRESVHGLRCRKGKVLYVLAEGGAPMMGDRAKAWLNHHETSVTDLSVFPHAVSLSSPNAVREILEIAGKDWDLFIFDTLARCMEGDENSVKDMSAAVKGSDAIREATGAAVLLVHHAGKDHSKGMRGSTALLGAVDAVLRMRPTGSNGHFEFRVEELRHGEPAESCLLRLVTNSRSAVLVDAHDAQSDFDPKTAIRDLAAALDDGTGRREFHGLVATEISCSVSTARRLTAEAVPLGKINGITTIGGITVWREGDPSSSSPKAEIIRNDKGH